jgi:transcription termination factor Rho
MPSTTTQIIEQTSGVLDIVNGANGFLRASEFLPSPHDMAVPAARIRQYGLRKGDFVEGSPGLADIERVNGRPADAVALRARPQFAHLTPLHPRERLRLETTPAGLATRLVDLVAPVGKGQRGLIVAPPKTGKTVILQKLADAIADNHPECHLMVVLLDERPEEVTDMRRSVRGEVLASTFDRPPAQHIALAELAIERAKRLVELGEDVVVLLDSLTRLCRAYNNNAGAKGGSKSSGRTLSGGVDAAALIGPKKLFGTARLAEEGGSLTILATALVDTGSRADDYFFEELKSTGNMELRLDRTLADQRIFPAVDVTPSGTRREELLLPPSELAAVRGLRRALQERDTRATLEVLLDRMKQTPSNAAFLRQLRETLPRSA